MMYTCTNRYNDASDTVGLSIQINLCERTETFFVVFAIKHSTTEKGQQIANKRVEKIDIVVVSCNNAIRINLTK